MTIYTLYGCYLFYFQCFLQAAFGENWSMMGMKLRENIERGAYPPGLEEGHCRMGSGDRKLVRHRHCVNCFEGIFIIECDNGLHAYLQKLANWVYV
ncbi:hypothetical protein Ocin01_19727 [Orchesella cincta]|uniref:Secreted protein n=1 Tax=Orchesella cincta TaxID=48709 RepID=A0A1D2M1W1_ORCCI|nr:hypothetical protein Ocin01_19727 [Orchesella cincta]